MFSGVDSHTHQVERGMTDGQFDLFGIHSVHEDDASADQWLLGLVGIPY